MAMIAATTLVEGDAEGPAMVWTVPLSFWGGLDVATGRVIDQSHPACGETVTGRVLMMPSGRGSSSSSSVLAEAIRFGTAPAALVLTVPDPIIAMGAIVAARLYGTTCPVVVCPAADLAAIAAGAQIRVSARPAGDAAIGVDGDGR
jgi:uncharacterized protein